jgi:periplasmic protein CpxP/Spy
MKKVMVATIASTILFLSVTTASPVVAFETHAQERPAKSFKGKHKHRMAKMAKALGLTEEQKTAIKDIREQAKSEKSVLTEQLSSFKNAAKGLMSKEEFDESAFLNLKNQHQETFTQLALLKAKTRHAIRQVLTPEQQEKADKFREKRKNRLFH